MFTDVYIELIELGLLEFKDHIATMNARDSINLYRDFISSVNRTDNKKHLNANQIYDFTALLDFENDCLTMHEKDDNESYINSIIAYAFIISKNFIDGSNKLLIDFEIAVEIISNSKNNFYAELEFSDDKTAEHSAVCAINYLVNSARRSAMGFNPSEKKYKRKFNDMTKKLLMFSKQSFVKRMSIIEKAVKTSN